MFVNILERNQQKKQRLPNSDVISFLRSNETKKEPPNEPKIVDWAWVDLSQAKKTLPHNFPSVWSL